MNRTIYFGPPGTGKTHTLLSRMQEALEQRIAPEQIAFLTFTRRARLEAVTRVEETIAVSAKNLPYFRTIHSMAYRALKLQDGDVLGYKQLKEFGKAIGMEFDELGATEQAAEGIYAQAKGTHFLAIDNLARLRGQAPEQIWSEVDSQYPWVEVEHFIQTYRLYKHDHGLLDFTDVLEKFVKSEIKLNVNVSFIDEAQDLSPLQWLAALQAGAGSQHQFVAGDDDQAIYRWAGADVGVFQDLAGSREILNHSFRLPRRVYAFAGLILSRIKQRVPKEFNPRDADGEVKRQPSAEALNLSDGGKWLWLVRNRYLMAGLKAHLEANGIVYVQHGATSIVESDKEAIYAWERLRTGRSIPARSARDLYAKLRSRSQVKHGYKLLPNLEDEQMVDMKLLRDQQGLLVEENAPWFDILQTIDINKRTYYRALLRKHKSLKLAPQVTLETIHGAKGAQSDHVALFLEMANRTYQESLKTAASRDDEHRVWYVGATRARETLHLIQGNSRYSYEPPRVTC